ncbi:malate dehydrogenase [Dirofilaria immitis]|nr:malate dehydrogenase [Dirofilaria immitis]
MVLRVLVTGAAGQIGYAVVLQIAKGDVFGAETPVVLVLFDVPPMLQALEGVQFELQDCALPTLKGVITTVKEEEAFKDIDYAFLIGAMPRKQGMERKDLLSANVKIFKSQGMAFAKYAKPTTKVIVVGNPANTNAFIAAKFAAPTVPERNFTSMTRLDHNRAMSQVAMKCGVGVTKNSAVIDAYEAINDKDWIQGPFISVVQKRGAVIIENENYHRQCQQQKQLVIIFVIGILERNRYNLNEWVSMGIPSDGSYGIPKGLIFSFPVTISGGEYKIVQGLHLDEFAKGKIAITQKNECFNFNVSIPKLRLNFRTDELEEERDEALQACA